MALEFPNINPVAVEFGPFGPLGPFQIHWYALAYVAGFILAWRLALSLCRLDKDTRPNVLDIDDYISWAIAGVLLGGRLGYVLFYNLPTYIHAPLEALKVWQGGMSFHGGALGVLASLILYAKIKKISFFRLADIIAVAVPIGLFLGRIANFVNGELFGRVTDVSWAVVFPRGGPEPRHPSQLYESFFEGPVLFIILFLMIRSPYLRAREGSVGAAFLFFYGLFRFGIEFFREPDVQLGFFFADVTMGQILCLPMMVAGALIYWWVGKNLCNKTILQT
ncbi:MAG: prolipoprotein diacylglyceryl transferase [Pseudomonadota bacterium]